MSLNCRICGKAFPELDQRGFRNAGFTAHQNWCIERQQQQERAAQSPTSANHPMISLPRPLLPAPASDSAGTGAGASAVTRANADTIRPLTTTDCSPHLSPVFSTQPSILLRTPVVLPTPYELQQQQEQRAVEPLPVRYCDYCTPQSGLHDRSCTVLDFISDTRPFTT